MIVPSGSVVFFVKRDTKRQYLSIAGIGSALYSSTSAGKSLLAGKSCFALLFIPVSCAELIQTYPIPELDLVQLHG